ncbi:8800_t:CDS:2, partial [Gigaspora margarita]
LPGTKPDDKPITKAKCKIEGCQTKYIWHESTLSKPYSVSRQQKLTRDIVKFLISCTLPLSLIENKNFHAFAFLNSFNPRYKPPYVNTIKNEIVNGTNHTTQVIKRVTCHWISDEFRIYDLILGLIEMGAYKTANDIVDSIEPILEEFGLEESKILSITMDNGFNVKLAVMRLLARLSVSDPIANIFCAAHTLQLSVEAGLEVARNLLTKCKALISLL